jgi:adenylate kinase family enzyme
MQERIMKRGENREDDNFETALQRIRTYHKFHTHTLEWLREQHVPIVNLDCTGPPNSVWYQMTAIGKLMRPAVKLQSTLSAMAEVEHEDWSGDPQRSAAPF